MGSYGLLRARWKLRAPTGTLRATGYGHLRASTGTDYLYTHTTGALRREFAHVHVHAVCTYTYLYRELHERSCAHLAERGVQRRFLLNRGLVPNVGFSKKLGAPCWEPL